MNKYTVVTRNDEYALIEIQHVEAKTPEEAFDVACQQIFEEACKNCGADIDDEDEKQPCFDNEELVCVLEGHCKCLINAAFDNQ
jgi:hypothetical protein